jgi:hypothetical protein
LLQKPGVGAFGFIVLPRGASFTLPLTTMTSCNFPSLQNGDQLVSYYPVKTIYGDISKEWCFRFVSYKGSTTTSKKFLNRIEKALDIRERMNAGYSFAGDNSNLPQLGNPFNGAV